MPSLFNANSAAAYEQVMGRWSRRLAPLLTKFAGVADGEHVLDVGCGTGSLTFALPRAANIAVVTGIDFAQPYIDHARRINTDPRITLHQGDACAMPFDTGVFDRAIAMLSLQFIPEVARAVREMRRAVQRGGTVAAAVWDTYGGMPAQRMFWDVAGVLDPDAIRHRAGSNFNPLARAGGLGDLWRDIGLQDVREAPLMVRMEFANFADYWTPIESGEAALGQYHNRLDDAARAMLRDRVRAAFEAGAPDGPRSLVAVALACRGTVPAAA